VVVSYLRAGVRLMLLAMVCLVMYSFLNFTAALVFLAERIAGPRGRTGRWRTRVFRFWADQVRAVMGLKVEVEGAAPEPPFVLVSNHLSYVDVILLGSQLRCVFVARADVAGWPLIGALCRSVETLFIDRSVKRDLPEVMRQMEQVLDTGRGVILFPEGTTTKGDGVLPFRPSLLDAAARAGRPVWYASLSYRTPPGSEPAQRSVCWWGDMPFTPHFLGVLGLPRIRARLSFGEQPIRESDRKILAARLQRAVERDFQAVV
jgi:1-acyl-sn-glycerol-3-phosphate acyltransferase